MSIAKLCQWQNKRGARTFLEQVVLQFFSQFNRCDSGRKSAKEAAFMLLQTSDKTEQH